MLECTGQSFKEVTPHKPGVTGTQGRKANLGASLLSPVPSALEFNITIGLMAPPEVTASHGYSLHPSAHDLSLLLIQTNKTDYGMTYGPSNKRTKFPTSTSFPYIGGHLLAEKWLAEETQNSCSPLCAVIATSACLLLPQCSPLTARTEMRWPNG